jgi:hypothetical protein
MRALGADIRGGVPGRESPISHVMRGPIPRLWPSSSSEGRTPRKETGSVFGAAGCCSMLENMVELVGIEPTTSSLRTMRVSITSSVFGTA